MIVNNQGLVRKINKRLGLKDLIDTLTAEMKVIDEDIKAEAQAQGLSLGNNVTLETSKGKVLVSMYETVSYNVTEEMQNNPHFDAIFKAKWTAEKKVIEAFMKTNPESELVSFIKESRQAKENSRVTQKLK